MAAEGSSVDYVGLLFVYGSLKRGERNHGQLREARLEGNGSVSGLSLYDLGPFPMAAVDPSGSSVLHGEIYAVTAEQLEHVDRFEGAPRLYERQLHRLVMGERSGSTWAGRGRFALWRRSPRAAGWAQTATNQRPARASASASADAPSQAERWVAS